MGIGRRAGQCLGAAPTIMNGGLFLAALVLKPGFLPVNLKGHQKDINDRLPN